jgi:hypothetical protein
MAFFTAFPFFLLSFPVFFFTIVQEIFFRWHKQSKHQGKKLIFKAPKDAQLQSWPAHKIFYVHAPVQSHKCHFSILKIILKTLYNYNNGWQNTKNTLSIVVSWRAHSLLLYLEHSSYTRMNHNR